MNFPWRYEVGHGHHCSTKFALVWDQVSVSNQRHRLTASADRAILQSEQLDRLRLRLSIIIS
jgi:hypothetical protein